MSGAENGKKKGRMILLGQFNARAKGKGGLERSLENHAKDRAQIFFINKGDKRVFAWKKEFSQPRRVECMTGGCRVAIWPRKKKHKNTKIC